MHRQGFIKLSGSQRDGRAQAVKGFGQRERYLAKPTVKNLVVSALRKALYSLPPRTFFADHRISCEQFGVIEA